MAALDTTPDVLTDNLRRSFGEFMAAFGAASEAGLDAQGIIAANLKDALGEDAWAALPLSVKMLLG